MLAINLVPVHTASEAEATKGNVSEENFVKQPRCTAHEA